MPQPGTLYRFKLEVSDIGRGFYGSIDTRVAMHPSESDLFLVTRVLAYALNFEDGLEFSAGGLSSPDDPAIWLKDRNGRVLHSIEIGNPSARRLHKASKSSDRVRVYTYKDVENLKREASGEKIYDAEKIEIFSFEQKFLNALVPHIKRDNSWSIMHDEGELTIGIANESFATTLEHHSLA